MSAIVFEDIFDVKDVDPQGKKFVRTSRLICHSMSYGMEVVLDVNTELYSLKLDDRFTLALAPTLYEGNAPDAFQGQYDQSGRESLANDFEYVMHGKVYRVEEGHDKATNTPQLSIYISFGGLLMRMRGDRRSLQDKGLDLDSDQYLLMRKV